VGGWLEINEGGDTRRGPKRYKAKGLVFQMIFVLRLGIKGTPDRRASSGNKGVRLWRGIIPRGGESLQGGKKGRVSITRNSLCADGRGGGQRGWRF